MISVSDSRPATDKIVIGGDRSPVNGIDKQKVALIHASETAKAEARDESVRRNGQVLNPAAFFLVFKTRRQTFSVVIVTAACMDDILETQKSFSV